MVIESTSSMLDATSAYQRAVSNLERVGDLGLPKQVIHDAPPSGFADILRTSIENIAETQREAESLSVKAVTGEASLIEVVGALNNAELTLNSVVAIRDRVLAAYQEIIRMPI